MKLYTLVFLMIFGYAQFIMPQVAIETPKDNPMSNSFAVTAEGGVTLAFTDYDKLKMNYIWKGAFEYFFASTGNGNIGLRAFGQTGFISGKDAPLSTGNLTNELSTKIDMYGGQVIYILSIADAIYPWVGLGVSNLWFYPKDGNGNKLPGYVSDSYSIHMLAYNGDIGFRFMATKNLSINLGAGIILGSKDFLDDIKTGSSNDMLYTATAGLSFYFGRDKDEDKDGVPDSRDACPNTSPESRVDEFGCPLDTDKDGIFDYLDKCSDTPAGVKVDENGCPFDSDGDGVLDYLDKCANTPAKVPVDAAGCPLDSDKDGVYDYLDKCPNTQAGIQVDEVGCATIDTVTVVVVEPAKIESVVLSGDTNFETNKAILLPSAYAALDGLVTTMKEHPEYKWEIGGHTDGVGSSASNQKLSVKRAQAVVDYLASKGVDKNMLVIAGYGEDMPVATNDTPEGRSMNRRVEIKLLTKN